MWILAVNGYYLVLLDSIKSTLYKKSPLQRPMAASSLLIAPSARKLMTSGGLSFALFLKEKNIFCSTRWLKQEIFSPETNDEVPKCEKCQAVVRPDVVLFGK